MPRVECRRLLLYQSTQLQSVQLNGRTPNPTTGTQRVDIATAETRRLSQGLHWREVADRVGMTEGRIRSRFKALRAAGYDDPMPPRD